MPAVLDAAVDDVPAAVRREATRDAAVVVVAVEEAAIRLPAMALDSARGTLEATPADDALFDRVARPVLGSFSSAAPPRDAPPVADLLLLAFVRSPRAARLRVPRVLDAADVVLEDVAVAPSSAALSFLTARGTLDVLPATLPVVRVLKGGRRAFYTGRDGGVTRTCERGEATRWCAYRSENSRWP